MFLEHDVLCASTSVGVGCFSPKLLANSQQAATQVGRLFTLNYCPSASNMGCGTAEPDRRCPGALSEPWESSTSWHQSPPGKPSRHVQPGNHFASLAASSSLHSWSIAAICSIANGPFWVSLQIKTSEWVHPCCVCEKGKRMPQKVEESFGVTEHSVLLSL